MMEFPRWDVFLRASSAVNLHAGIMSRRFNGVVEVGRLKPSSPGYRATSKPGSSCCLYRRNLFGTYILNRLKHERRTTNASSLWRPGHFSFVGGGEGRCLGCSCKIYFVWDKKSLQYEKRKQFKLTKKLGEKSHCIKLGHFFLR